MGRAPGIKRNRTIAPVEAGKPAANHRVVIWTPLGAALEESLVDRGGILNFAHDFLRTAVETAFVSHEAKRDELRLRLADDFEQQPVSARSCDELPWLLRQTASDDQLRSCLLNLDRFLLIHDRDRQELMRYWVDLNEERTMGRAYLDEFEPWSRTTHLDDTRLGDAANELAVFLEYAALHAQAEPLYRRALALHRRASVRSS